MDAKSYATSSDYDGSSNVGSFGSPSQVRMIVPTESEEEQQGMRTNGEHLASLPRSVRWRIQLGLLKDPSADDSVTNANNNRDGKRNCNVEVVFENNRDVIQQQEDRFKALVQKYVEETTDVGNDEHATPPLSPEEIGFDSAKPAEIDPLTAMVMEKEAQETRKAELYLKYRKERARMKRGLATEARVIESESDGVDQASVSTLIVMCHVIVKNPICIVFCLFSNFFVIVLDTIECAPTTSKSHRS